MKEKSCKINWRKTLKMLYRSKCQKVRNVPIGIINSRCEIVINFRLLQFSFLT